MKFNSLIISYTDDIIMTCDDPELLRKEKDRLTEELRAKGWAVNKEKSHSPDTSTKFLGIQRSSEGTKVPNSGIDKIKEPANKTEAQHLTGL